MKDFELKSLIFNDNEKFRSFQSSDFNFILDKNTRCSICYGSTIKETPSYDPLSPEIIDLYIDNDFKFCKNDSFINKLFNINVEKNNELITISTISTVNIIIDDIYNVNIIEVNKLCNYLNQFNFFLNLEIPYKDSYEFRDVMKMTLFNVQNISINIKNFKAEILLDQTNLILSKDLKISYNFYISKLNYEEFIKLIKNEFPKNTFSNIYFNEKISKIIKNKIIKVIDDKENFTICDTQDVKNTDIKYRLIQPCQDGLFKCYISFEKQKVSYSSNFKKGILFNKIDRINSYWHSNVFKKYRSLLITEKYEKEKIKSKSRKK